MCRGMLGLRLCEGGDVSGVCKGVLCLGICRGLLCRVVVVDA